MSVATFPQEAMTWLGRLPAGWQVKPLKHVVRVNPEALSDSTDPDWRMTYADISSVSLGQGIVDAQEFAFTDSPSRARRLVKAGDTLVSTVRTYLGAITLVREPPENLVASTGFAVMRPGSDIDPNFLGYFATSDAFVNAVVAQSVGVSYPATNASDIVRLPIAFPDIDQQQKIAAFLDRKTAGIDTLIAKKRRLLDRLAEKRTALITRAVTKGLNPDAPMKDSGIEWLGEIPAHWEVARLKNITQLESGHTPSKSKPEFWVDCDIPWVSLRDTKVLADNDYISQTHTYINKAGLAGSSARLLPAGTVIFTRDATVGLVAITEVEMAVSQHLIAWVPSEKIDKYYLLFVFEAMRDYLHSLEFGSTVRTIGMDDIRRLVGPVPPVSEQLEIVDSVLAERGRLQDLEARVNEAIEKLKEYRSALITNAVTGQIKVA